MSILYEISGQRFGRLIALEIVPRSDRKGVYWRCQCDCGNEKVVDAISLIYGRTKSCGCLHNELLAKRSRKYSSTDSYCYTHLYSVWSSIKSRCHSPSSSTYDLYNALGITVCDEWRYDFNAFREWSLKNGYKEGMKLARYYESKGFFPNNCFWKVKKKDITPVFDSKFRNLYGMRFGNLVALNVSSKHKKIEDTIWHCLCDCGNSCEVSADKLLDGSVLTCGCPRQPKSYVNRKYDISLGDSYSKLYTVWKRLKRANKYPSDHKKFFNIIDGQCDVCDEWLNSYITFRDWSLSNGYEDGKKLERYEKSKGFLPNNCYWSS